MIKADFNVPVPTEEEEENRVHLAQELAENTEVRKLLADQGIPEALLQERPYIFSSWLKKRSGCQGCQSLQGCAFSRRGFREGLRYDDGLLLEVVEACPYEQKREAAQAHLSNYLISDLGEEFATVGFENISLDEESEAYVQTVQKVWHLCTSGRGCYLWGSMGSGKTYLAACASNYWAKKGKKAAFVHVPAFAQRVGYDFRSKEYEAEVQLLMYVDVLVLDDIGAEDCTDKFRSVLLSVLDARMRNRKMTWFTSNADFPSLHNHFLVTSQGSDHLQADRVMERIRVLGQPVFVKHADRRKLFDTQQ